MKSAQSKTLALLSFVQMWKFFSHFGVRILLVLYMVEHLRYSDVKAFEVNAVFCGLIELGGIFGGIIADRYLGLKKTMLIGGGLLGVGYIGLILENALFVSMGMIVVGGSLFSGNIMALLGLAYAENDPKRTRGFTIFYMMQNLGALIATGVCGLVATYYGFRLGFALASSGMIVGYLVLLFYQDLLRNLEELPKRKSKPMQAIGLSFLIFLVGIICVSSEKVVLLFLPWITGSLLLFFARQVLKDLRILPEQAIKFFIYLGALVLFFAVEDQICSSLLLFVERQTDRVAFGWTIPSSSIACLNPIVILLFGAVVAKKHQPLITPFMLTAAVFALLAGFCLINLDVSIFGVMGIVAVISVAELMVGPMVMSYASEMSAKGRSGMIMGMVPIAFSLAFQLSGEFSKMVAVEDSLFSLETYGFGFGMIAILLVFGGIFLQFLMNRFGFCAVMSSNDSLSIS